jgi:hypothetical protein
MATIHGLVNSRLGWVAVEPPERLPRTSRVKRVGRP